MNRSRSKLAALAFALALTAGVAAAAAADERVSRTGSRVGSDATGRSVIHFGAPGEIRRVRILLDEGRTDEAIALAEDYLVSLDRATNVSGAVPQRYDAFNALCAALTQARRLDEAVARCTEAIDLIPSRWSAINNRGTAYFAQGNYVRALEDYQRAEPFARSANAESTVRHNIALAERRIASRAPDG